MTKLLRYVLNQGEPFRRARLPSLYSDFSLQRRTNPDGYAANILAWEDVLIKAAGEGLLPPGPDGPEYLSLRTGEELLQSLETREWGRPLAIGNVIDEAVSQQRLIPVKQFLKSSSTSYDQGWSVAPSWLLTWGLRQFGMVDRTSGSSNLRNGQWEAASRIISCPTHTGTHADRVYSMGMFRNIVAEALGHTEVTDADLSIILTFLSRDKRMIIYDHDVIKFKARGKGAVQISSEDRTIASLKALINDLNLQSDHLMTQIIELTAEAQVAANAQLRSKALHALRSKKTIEGTLARRLETISILEGLYANIEQATDQIALVRVIKSSTAILRNLNSQVSNIEKIEDLMEGLRDQMIRVEEVGEVIGQAGQGDTVDDNGIDEELHAMMEQVRANREEEATLKTEKSLRVIKVKVPSSGVKFLQAQNLPEPGRTVSEPRSKEESPPPAAGARNAPTGVSLDDRQALPVENQPI